MKVEPYETGLHQGNAYWMAKIAEAAYITKEDESAPDRQEILKELRKEPDGRGFQDVKGYDRKSSQAILVDHRAFLCVAFRGTDELSDWLDNANILKTDDKLGFGEFHQGFWNATADIWDEIDADIQTARDKKKRPLFITGHSLGGAMATVATAILISEDRPFTSTYTFGQPRAVARDTGRLLNAECRDRYFRFCNNQDIVTRIPARIGGFTHVGQIVYIDNDLEMHQNIGRWQQFLDTVDGVVEKVKEKGIKGGITGLKEFIQDHEMNHYMEAVENWKFA